MGFRMEEAHQKDGFQRRRDANFLLNSGKANNSQHTSKPIRF